MIQQTKNDYAILIALLGVAIVVFLPFLNTGFGTGDDVEFMLTAKNGSSWQMAKMYANDTGRFYFLLTKPLYDLPYLLADYPTLKAINILFVLLNFLLIAKIAQLFSNKYLGYFTFLITLVFVSIKGGNNPIVSFLLYFSVSFSFILASILFTIKFGKENLIRYRNLSWIFFAIGLLFYEVYIMYLPLVVFILSYKFLQNTGYQKKKGWRQVIKAIYPIAAVGVLYLIIYFSFRNFISPAIYDGTKFAGTFDFYKSLNVINNLASGAFPGFSYFNGHHVYWESSYLLESHQHGIFNLLRDAKPEWYFKAIIVGLISHYLISRIKLCSLKKSLLVVVVCFLYVYFPQIPISLSEKYSVQYPNSTYYVSTYFSYISVGLLFSIVLVLPICIGVKWLKNLLLYFSVIIVSLGSLMTDYANYHAVVDLQNPKNTFDIIDDFIETDEFKSIPDNSFIYAPNLFSKSSKISWVNVHNWSYYIYMKSSKNINFSKSKDELINEFKDKKRPVYSLKFGYNRKEKDRYLALGKVLNESKIDSLNCNILSDSICVYYYSTHKDFTLSFANELDSLGLNHLCVNDSLISSNKNFQKIRCKYINYDDYFKPVRIKADRIDMNSLSISNNYDKEEVDVEL